MPEGEKCAFRGRRETPRGVIAAFNLGFEQPREKAGHWHSPVGVILCWALIEKLIDVEGMRLKPARLGDAASSNEELFVKHGLQPLRGNEMPLGDIAYSSATLK